MRPLAPLLLCLIFANAWGAEVTRKDVDAAAAAYAAAVLAHYTALVAKAVEPPEPAKTTDASTVQHVRQAERAKADREVFANLRNQIGALAKQVATEAPGVRALRAAQYDHSVLNAPDGEARRRMLGLPEPGAKR